MNKLSYKQIVAANLVLHEVKPGDVISLILRNEESDEGIYQQARRIYSMFAQCYRFLPQVIVVHPDHLAILTKQGKTLDVLLSEEGIKQFGHLIDLTGLPERIPLIGDETLDLFTTVARFTFKKEDTEAMITDVFKTVFDMLGDIS